jgi:2-amino-4-hydroxy-6-hydroxymethyldihydropteridine diphosphokinase
MPKVALGLGSNISPRRKYISQALENLAHFFSPLRTSGIYQTSPYERKKQKNYYNLIATFTSEEEPAAILEKTKAIEQKLGRAPLREKKTSRTIDIDILFYGEQKIQSEKLIIPHYDLWNRDFFLIPLLEVVDKDFPNGFQKNKIKQALLKIKQDQKTNPKLVL